MAKSNEAIEVQPVLMKDRGKLRYTLHQMRVNIGCYGMLAPFMILFTIFMIIPVIMSLPMGFTNFNMVQFPKFIGLSNFYTLFLNDDIFLTAVKNTLVFAIFTGPFSYVLSFFLAWLINEMHPALKTIFTFVFYAPSMTPSVYVIWQLLFSGDTYGYFNSVLLDLGFINAPVQWLTDTAYMFGVVIVVQLWISMGAGFLALRAGFQNIDKSFLPSQFLQWDHSFYLQLYSRFRQHSQSELLDSHLSVFRQPTIRFTRL